ncbi:MAG: PQQ-dependent sugar dehydrogenase, partial [Bacteroidota bacterium]
MSTATFPRFVVALALLASPAAHAQLAAASAQSPSTPGLPAGFYLEDAVDASFVQPVAVAFAPGGRMFVVEKRGYVWTVQNGVLQSEPFIDLRDEVLNQHDRGLLGIAVDPDFAQNRRVYLSYTVDHEETSDRQRLDAYARIESYAGRADNPNVADLSSRRILIGETFETGIASCYRSHTIGTLAFGADGTLIVGSGDGANYTRTDPGGQYDECFGPGRLDESEDIGAFRSQRVESLAGKMLRIDPVTGEGLPSNPFWTGDGRDNASKVWVLGLRNPFRFSLDPASGASDPSAGRPGRLYIGDVGWSVWEEINVAEGGENYGWPCWEGPALHGSYPDLSPATNSCADDNAGALAAPSYYWHHSRSNRSVPSGRTARAIVSGDVYRGQKYPAYYRGALFYGDYTRGWMAASQLGGAGQPTQERTFSTDIGPIVAYVYDAASEYLHLVNVFSGRIQRLRHTDEAANAAPVAQASATPAQGGAGLRVQFSPAGSFDPDGDALSYTWAFGDGATSDARAPVHAYPSPGVYTAELAASDGVLVTRAEVAVTVRTGAAPTIQITAPRATTRGTTGQAIQLAASVSDPDQSNGTLFVRWTVTQIHDDHVHLDVFTGADPETEFVIPEHGLPGEQVYYRIRAEVRDATGLTAIDEVPLFLASDVGETDVSAEGTIIASVLSPAGGRGSRDPEVIRDGVEPSPGASDTGRQFATYTGARDQDEDWIGYAFAESKRLARVSFQEGLHQADGGWFERPPRVQVRRGGTWRDVVGLEISPAYRADDGRGYDTYDLRFAPAEGDAIRIAGPPAGDNGYISVAELRVFEVSGEGGSADVPAPWTSADVGAPAGAGSAGVIGDVFSVTGGGDIWNQTDGFHFVHQPFDGDGSITAQIVSLTPGTEWFKAGVMIRSSLDADAPHASLLVSNIGAHAQARVSAGGVSTAHGDAWGRTAPGWIRLERSG